MILNENRITQANDKYTAFIEKNITLYRDLVAAPFMVETQHKYLDWLLSVLQKEKTEFPFREIINILTKFNKVSSSLERKNIYSYTDLNDVQHAVINFISKQAREEGIQKELEVILDTNEYLLVRPHTYAAALKVGRVEHFSAEQIRYTIDNGILLIIVDKKDDITGVFLYDDLILNLNNPKMSGWCDPPKFVIDRIRHYIMKQPTAHKYLSPREFAEEFDLTVVANYPRSFVCGEKEIACSYVEENKVVKLVYTIDFYNAILYVACDLFDPQHPLSIHMQNKTAKSKESEKTLMLPYDKTAFVRKQFFDFLSANNVHKVVMEKALRMVELTICSFTKSPEFLHFFDEDAVYHDVDLSGIKGDAIAKFLEYVAQQQESERPATRRDFLENFLKRDISTIKVRSNANRMYDRLVDTGIIEYKKTPIGYTYVLGPNYKAYTEGRVKATSSKANPWE